MQRTSSSTPYSSSTELRLNNEGALPRERQVLAMCLGCKASHRALMTRQFSGGSSLSRGLRGQG